MLCTTTTQLSGNSSAQSNCQTVISINNIGDNNLDVDAVGLRKELPLGVAALLDCGNPFRNSRSWQWQSLILVANTHHAKSRATSTHCCRVVHGKTPCKDCVVRRASCPSDTQCSQFVSRTHTLTGQIRVPWRSTASALAQMSADTEETL
eukprot:317058-Amphidinium_carterae.3